MSDEALARAVRPSPDVLARAVGEELVLLDLASEEYYALDDIGAAMWEAISSAPNLAAARDALLAEFDVEAAKLAGDLLELVDRLSAKGLLVEAGT